IYLSAPRRVGKTSILKHLEEFPKEGYYFIYIITESIDNSNEFFKVVFEELVSSDAIKKLSRVSHTVKDFLTGVFGKIKSIKDVELREAEESDYYALLIELFSNILPEHGRVVIMIDEFPQTIQNILEKENQKVAETFLQKNRELRHHKNIQEKINFIYTGSVSLFPMVQKVTSLTSINDLRTVDVEPLEREDAKKFLSLLLKNDDINLNGELLDYVIDKIKWLIPFHIQLMQQEIVDVYESSNKTIDAATIDKAFDQVVHSRNKPQFEPYFSRLAKIFKAEEYEFVIEILKYIAQNDKIENDVLHDTGVKHKLAEIKTTMEILEGDGYLIAVDGGYQYTSPFLKLWCKKHICK
ncbi:MAG TPA: ATP-binding protein, partial [Bacteroidia bacterium]|nr:ATP-binding protein [Bacteroidia bacterium]